VVLPDCHVTVSDAAWLGDPARSVVVPAGTVTLRPQIAGEAACTVSGAEGGCEGGGEGAAAAAAVAAGAQNSRHAY
jgi:hypothetical protein